MAARAEGGRPLNACLRVLDFIDRALGWCERIIVAGSVLLMAALMSGHVVGNLLFGTGIPGTYEITEMLIVVMTFVGVGYAARCARHISMSAIYDQLSGRPRKALLILISVGTGALMFYFAYKAAQYDIQIHDRGRVSSSVHVPLWLVYLALPIGFTLAGVQYLLTVVRNLVSPGVWRSFREEEEYASVPVDDSGATHADDTPRGV
ncbi:TRAP transporter small permease [Salinisphaera sp. Q1T1-3]|uniref:TRAP transporter small permease n=1 Tax=Salinisphaera sp. Q1T1-3 TaxID=2321229 RepID=UPI000E7320F3|nr:TRAP transporter small permease [Salinisphaera sp. Q1T1-3]RJS91215.1 TRAP transporter small permease [Salinisphaera sp. Q1T1-3]